MSSELAGETPPSENQTQSGGALTIIRNFRNGHGWDSVVLGSDDIDEIQKKLREFNKGVLEESMRDAKDLLASYTGPYEARTKHICELGMFLASKRIVDIRTVYEEFLRTKIWIARRTNGNSEGEE